MILDERFHNFVRHGASEPASDMLLYPYTHARLGSVFLLRCIPLVLQHGLRLAWFFLILRDLLEEILLAPFIDRELLRPSDSSLFDSSQMSNLGISPILSGWSGSPISVLHDSMFSLMKCPQHYLTEMQEVILFYNRLDVQTKQILDSKGVIPSKTVADAKVAIQEMAKYSQKWHNKTSRTRSNETFDRLAAIQAQLNNLGREIKKVNEKVYAAQVGCEQ
ncbi:hypothetical protein Tco_0365874, partial [Tanacetum coccineum]